MLASLAIFWLPMNIQADSLSGIATVFGTLAETPIQKFEDHFNVNTMGVLILYQATHALLAQSKQPKFVLISTVASSMGAPVEWPIAAM
jgi:NAD(P)-dependent dehydrogenase (short-subunit alcohol dehydrogenase family)